MGDKKEAQPGENVNDLYDRIFTNDPLLLDEGNQLLFGNQILRNLLVERAISTSELTEVDLSCVTSRDKFKRLPLSTVTSIPDAIRRAYLSSRFERSRLSLSSKDESTLKDVTMVANAEFTVDRLPRRKRKDKKDKEKAEYTVDEKAETVLEKSKSPLETRLKIAVVGYRVPISKLPDAGLLKEDLAPRPVTRESVELPLIDHPEGKSVEKLRRTKLRTEAEYNLWRDTIRRHVRRALNRRANFVVLPEFALPPNGENNDDVVNELRDIANAHTHEFFLFSGSRHEGTYNRGFILRRQAKDTKVTDAWWHYKVASARGLGENIMGPQTIKVPGYKFTLNLPGERPIVYRVLVAICYDVFDPTTFLNYLLQCADGEVNLYENVILVPSFNPAREFIHALRDLSFIAKCPVIYVNGLHGDAKLFLYGVAVADLASQEGGSASSQKRNGKKKKMPEKYSPLDQSFRETQDQLARQIDEEYRSFRALQRIRDTTIDGDVKRAIIPILNDLGKRQKILNQRAAKLAAFKETLDGLRTKDVLKHLITTEHCKHCDGKGHSRGGYCAKDLLYYNIDVRLIRELQQFRDTYFDADGFLPLPFRQDQRQAISDKISKKQLERALRSQ